MKPKRRAYAPRMPADQRRAQLLDAALRLIVSRGHQAVTMEAVADAAGVTKPVVYGVFANRAELLDALLQREQRQALEQLLGVLSADLDDRPPAEFLAHALAKFLQAVRETPDRWHCIVMPMPGMPPRFHAAREQARAAVLERAQDIARSMLHSLGAPPELDPEIAAQTMVTLAEMAARLVLTESARYDPGRFVAALRAAVGMATSTEPGAPPSWRSAASPR